METCPPPLFKLIFIVTSSKISQNFSLKILTTSTLFFYFFNISKDKCPLCFLYVFAIIPEIAWTTCTCLLYPNRTKETTTLLSLIFLDIAQEACLDEVYLSVIS